MLAARQACSTGKHTVSAANSNRPARFRNEPSTLSLKTWDCTCHSGSSDQFARRHDLGHAHSHTVHAIEDHVQLFKCAPMGISCLQQRCQWQHPMCLCVLLQVPVRHRRMTQRIMVAHSTVPARLPSGEHAPEIRLIVTDVVCRCGMSLRVRIWWCGAVELACRG